MNKILMSTLAIVAVVAVAGVGSYAMWSDSDTSKNNYLKAGSLDLQFSYNGVDWEDTLVNKLFELNDVYPGQGDGGSVGLVKNAGTVDGKMIVSLENIRNNEEGLAEPEVGAPLEEPGTGELCENVKVRLTFDKDGSNEIVSDWKVADTAPTWNFGNNAILAGDSFVKMGAEYKVLTSAGNEIMTDKCLMDIVVTLEQL